MPKIDVTKYIEQSGIRRARFGGYEPEDVRQLLAGLSAEYEKRLAQAEAAARKLQGESAALEQHCRALTSQNQKLAAQNAALAGSSEKFSRRLNEMDAQLSTATEKAHSLGDQLAVFRLKNADLVRENDELKDRAEQAEAELRIKGRALDAAKAELEANRTQKLAEADAAAAQTVAEARAKADKIVGDAQVRADAIERAGRAQAQIQAQNLVDAAAEEANEVQNAHQLRLNHLHAEVRKLEKERAAILDYLKDMGSRLEALHDTAAGDLPQADADDADDEEPPVLEQRPAPAAHLDLSEESIAAAMRELENEKNAAPQDDEQQENDDSMKNIVVEPPQAPTRAAAFTLMGDEPDTAPAAPAPTLFGQEDLTVEIDESDPTHQTGPALTEVPGAIFSAPVVRGEGPVLDELPPTAMPRSPVLPSLQDEDEAEPEPDGEGTQPGARPSAARSKAIKAVRAIRRKMAKAAKGGVQ